jgi:hypothetical protein
LLVIDTLFFFLVQVKRVTMVRGTATNKLADVIQMLQMARKSGILRVNRDRYDDTIEHGIVVLQNGQIVDASLGIYRGNEALQRLQGWQLCYFVFQMSTQSSSPPLPAVQNSSMNRNVSTDSGVGAKPDTGAQVRRVPQRTRAVNEVLTYFERMGLTRLHRQLFLLIDGHRSVSEMIVLIGHRTDEIDMLLDDLERAGLIRW